MPIQDKVVTWFLQNILVPRQEIIDKPGFIVSTVSEENKKINVRELLLPEGLFEKIEKMITQKYGEEGRHVLYSVGKKFGYVYASLSGFPQLGTAKDKDVENFAYFFVRYMAGTYASEASHQIDLKSKTFKITLKDYLICRNDGIGLLMTDGGCAGIWAWVCDDYSVEAIQDKCQGRGDQTCEVLCAPAPVLKNMSKSFFVEKSKFSYSLNDEYIIRNKIRETTNSKNSLRALLDNRFFDYNSGKMLYNGKRFFLDDADILYIIEKDIGDSFKKDNILFEAAFEEGKEIAKAYANKSWSKFITDFFGASGFGDIIVLDTKKPRIGLVYYPWSILSAKSEYQIIRGLLSGIITICSGEDVSLKLLNIKENEFLTITVSV